MPSTPMKWYFNGIIQQKTAPFSSNWHRVCKQLHI